MNKKTTYISWALAVFVAFVFLQSLPYKFSAHTETELIFSTIGQWMSSIGLPQSFSDGFANFGGYIIGSIELIAAILLLLPKTRFWGALLGLGVMSGAVFFHLFTPLGVNRVIDEAGNTDGGVLFYMACGAWLSCAFLLLLHKGKSTT